MVINIQDDILKLHALGLLDSLLVDQTTSKHILWASDAYIERGQAYEKEREITSALITGDNSDVIKTRARKSMEQQTERTRKHGEVFTPVWVCKKMNDHIDEVWFRRRTGFSKTNESGHVFFPKGKTWHQYADSRRLEITCGEAPYLVSRYDPETGEMIPIPQRIGILDRKLRVVSENAVTEEEWFTWAIRSLQATYGYEFQGDSLLIGRVNILMTFEEYLSDRWNRKPTSDEYKTIIRIITWNIWQMDGLKGLVPYSAEEEDQLSLFDAEPKQPSECRIYNWRKRYSFSYLSMKGERARMRIKFLTGNPPYQEETDSNSTRMPPIYNLFMDQAYDVADVVELITPARFLFNAGQTPKAWNQKMLEDPHLKVLYYEQDASKIFANTDIKGGVAITYRDANKQYGPIKAFVPYLELRTILEKAGAATIEDSLTDIADSSNVYDLKNIYADHPDYKKYVGDGGKHSQLKTNVLNINPIFTDTPTADNDYAVCGLVNGKRGKKYCHRHYIKAGHKSLHKYKVLVPKATGSGKFGDALPEIFVVQPEVAFTQTYISIGTFETELEAANLSNYLKTKFCRALLYVLKVTQDNLPAVWRFIPKQNFTNHSDIDWSKSIPEIDQQLYAKYGLSEEEIAFIESHVKEME